jgi:hypothetical protein
MLGMTLSEIGFVWFVFLLVWAAGVAPGWFERVAERRARKAHAQRSAPKSPA